MFGLEFGLWILDQPTLWSLIFKIVNLLVPFALKSLQIFAKEAGYKSNRANIWLGHLGCRSSLQMWSQMFICSDLIWNVTLLRIWKVARSVNRLSSNRTLEKINTDRARRGAGNFCGMVSGAGCFNQLDCSFISQRRFFKAEWGTFL